jgi:arylsulfatase
MSRPSRWARAPRLLALGLLACACSDGPEPGAAPAGPPRYPRAPVLLISVDTLRADRLGCYGYARGTTPRLDAFAEEAVLFEQAYSTSCKTAEAHMSLFTSLPVSAHGVSNSSKRLNLEVKALGKNRLTLPQVLNRAGYWTAAVASGANLHGPMGFARGFEQRFTSELEDVSVIVNRVLEAVDAGLRQPEPLFLFMHTYQCHGPYLPPEEYLQRFAPEPRGLVGKRVQALAGRPFQEQWGAMFSSFWLDVERFGPEDAAYLSDLYDGEIAYTDSEVGRLLDELEERELLDRMVVVVTSDHGEEFAEHGHYEHDQLYDELLHVPLLVRLPGGQLGGTRVTGQASLLDVMPTLLELLELSGPDTMTGQSLVPALTSRRTPDRPILAERTMFPEAYMATLRMPAASAIFEAAPRTLAYYDLKADPGQRSNLGTEAPFATHLGAALYRELAAVLVRRAQLDAEDAGESVTLDEATLKALGELNYLGKDGDLALPPGSPLDSWPADGPR